MSTQLKMDRITRYDQLYALAGDCQREELDQMIINAQAYMRKRTKRLSFGIGMAKELIVSLIDHLPATGSGPVWATLNGLKQVEDAEVKVE